MIYELFRRAIGLTAPKRPLRVQRDLRATMADGTVLLADLTSPADVTQAPLLLVRCPYGRRTLLAKLYARTLAGHGFQVLVQSCRGTAGSGGAFDRPFAAEADDGRDTVAWLRAQPFYPGRFATIGGSYLGYTQLALPPKARAELFAAVLQITPASVADVCWADGALALEASLGWATQARRGPDRFFANMLRSRHDGRAVRRAGRSGVLLDRYVQATGGRVPFLEDWWTHDAGDRWWRDQDRTAAVDGFDCPVLVQAGWFDIFLEAGLDQFRRLSSRRDDARLTVGPWTHASFTLQGGRTVMEEAAAFLLACAAGHTLPAPPVRLLDARSGAEERFSSWPPAAVERVLHLRPGRLTDDVLEADALPTSFTYDPEDPTPAVGGPRLAPGAGPQDNAALEARADVVTFDGDPITRPVRLCGATSVALWIVSDVPAPQLLVRLNIVDADGVSKDLTDRIVTVAGPASPAEPILVRLDLPPVWVELRAGERIRLLVAGGAYPRYARSPGSGASPASAARFDRARIGIVHDRDHASTLTLRVHTPE